MKQEDVTIVIPTLDSHMLSDRALKICLESLNATAPGVRKIISLNNTDSTTATDEIKAVTKSDFTFSKEQGQCGALNRAVKEVSTPWVFVSNNDMVYPPGWFEALTREVDSYKLLVASPNLVEPRKGAPPFIEKFCGGIGTAETQPDFNKHQFLQFAKNHQEHVNRPDLSVENGFNLPFLIRKDVWDAVGGADEAYDPWGSCWDTDFQTRLMIAGITPKRVRSSIVYHFSNTSGTFHPDNDSYKHENWRYYEDKFGFPAFTNPDVWYLPTIPDTLKYHPDYEGQYE